MKKNIILNILIVLNVSSIISALPSPYSELKEVLPFNGHGWYSNAAWIEKLMKTNKISTFIEVGSWMGASTRHIASLLQPNGKLYAVDTWQGSIEHYQKQEWNAMLPTLYNQFLSNMIHARLTDVVIPMRMSSLEAAPILKQQLTMVDMVYIDAAHDTESVFNDLNAYWPFVKDNGGILCGDDWDYDPVKVAVRKFAQLHGLVLYWGDNFWFLKQESGHVENNFRNTPMSVWQFNIVK